MAIKLSETIYKTPPTWFALISVIIIISFLIGTLDKWIG